MNFSHAARVVAVAMLLSLAACAGTDKPKTYQPKNYSSAESLAADVFDGFRNGTLRSLAMNLSETEGMGGSMSAELKRSKERYHKASKAEQAKLLEEMKKDGVEGIIDGTWRDGLTFLMLGADGDGAKAWKKFLAGIGKEVKGERGPKGGQWFVAKDAKGRKVEMLVRKGKDGKFYVENMRGDSPDDSDIGGPEPMPKTGDLEALAQRVFAEINESGSLLPIADHLVASHRFGQRAKEEFERVKGNAAALKAVGLAYPDKATWQQYAVLSYQQKCENNYKHFRAGLTKLGKVEASDSESEGQWFIAPASNEGMLAIAFDMVDGKPAITWIDIDGWPRKER